ncbi:hypothetical protein J3A83DRAFT_177459 [Scleroderma citrinum]
MIRLGSTTQHLLLTEESAWEIINVISTCLPEERRPLLIQRQMADEHKPLHQTSLRTTALRFTTAIFSGFRRFLRPPSKNPEGYQNSQDKTSLPPRRRFSTSSLFASILSHTSRSSHVTATDESISTGLSSSTGSLSEHSYRAALRGVITTLKLAHSITEFVCIHCLKEAIAPSLSIAHAIEAMDETRLVLLRVVENAALLIGMITERVKKAQLTTEVKTAISSFAKGLKRVDGTV